MKLNRIATGAAVLALSVAPGVALATQPTNPGSNGRGHNNGSSNTNTPGPNASQPTKAKAYGKFCQGQSKQHVAGTPGTAFSKCVTDMAKAAHGTNPTTACKNESKKHVKGEKGTPYSRCVSGAAKLQSQQGS
jgi:hypothetical protein